MTDERAAYHRDALRSPPCRAHAPRRPSRAEYRSCLHRSYPRACVAFLCLAALLTRTGHRRSAESLRESVEALLRRRRLPPSGGLPTVRYCAQELFLSPNYFGDLVRQLTGATASNAIRRFLMHRARNLIVSGHTVSQTAAMLGFDHPQHFTRMFKKYHGLSPPKLRKARFEITLLSSVFLHRLLKNMLAKFLLKEPF